MEDFKALIIGIFGAFIVLIIRKVYRKFQIKSINQDIDLLEVEKKHLEAMKYSSVEMSRSAYKSLFIIISIILLGELIANFVDVVINNNKTALNYILLGTWTTALGLSLKFTKRYHNLGNYEASIKQMEEKLNKLKKKAQKSANK